MEGFGNISDYTQNMSNAADSLSSLKQNRDQIYGELQDLQTNISESHSLKQKHIEELKKHIKYLSTINHTRKIQRSKFTKMGMTGYHILNIVVVAVLIGIIVYWLKITKSMSSADASLKNMHLGLVAFVVIFIVMGLLLINAFWSMSVRDQMKKSNYLYQFPQYGQ